MAKSKFKLKIRFHYGLKTVCDLIEKQGYINTITDKNSKDFIPVENRIAVFDMDGTLCCETDPGYFDHKLLYHRVMEDVDYKDKASAEEKETAQIIKTYFETGEYPK